MPAMRAMLRASFAFMGLLLGRGSVYAAAAASADVVTVSLHPQSPASPRLLVDTSSDSDEILDSAPPRNNDNVDLTAWATEVTPTGGEAAARNGPITEAFVVVGVKTNVLHNFPARQAIRQTWAQRRLLDPLAVRVVFLGCEPDFSSYTNTSERMELERAIAMEKRVFQDLLTSELDCTDSYGTLVAKVASYMHWIATSEPFKTHPPGYVVVADDDAYVRVDKLLSRLQQSHTPRTRLYAGWVWHTMRPIRVPSDKNYVSEREYPMATFPLYAGGPFYVLSIDLVHFVARNRRDLKGIGANDDLSIAVWLLPLGVQPTHWDDVVVLRVRPCRHDAVVIVDLSPPAVRLLYQNDLRNRSLCEGFVHYEAVRHHRTIIIPSESNTLPSTDESNSRADLEWDLQHHAESNTLNIQVTIKTGTKAITYAYVPATEGYEDALCTRGAKLLHDKLYVEVDEAFCEFHRGRLHSFLHQTVDQTPTMHALLTLASHNLKHQTHYNDLKVVVLLSREASHSRVLVECLFVEMYPNALILVVNDLPPDRVPDVVVFSVLDSLERDLASISAEYVAQFGLNTPQIMIAGEAWDITGLDPRVILLSTVASVEHANALHIPVASSVFAESIQHSPLELLQPFVAANTTEKTRRFCAYLYARCDRIRRELVFDLLNTIEPVDALGACQGTQREPLSERRRARFENPFYTDEAVALYRDYRFVIAFENTFDAVGYVTEKIVTAFLAGAVPVYFGHSASVKKLFNTRAFINCGDFESLHACAQFVDRVHSTPEAYDAMRHEAPVVNRTAFFEAFSWHPQVAQWGVDPTNLTTGIRLSARLRRLLDKP